MGDHGTPLEETGKSEEVGSDPGHSRLVVKFTLDHAIPNVFAPLRLPRFAEVLSTGVDASLVNQGFIRVSGELGPGRYEVPITPSQSLSLDVHPGCQFDAWARAGSPFVEESAEPSVTMANLTFEPPLDLGNVFPTLASLPELFEDNIVRAIRHRLTRSAPVRALALGISAARQAMKGQLTVDGTSDRDGRSSGSQYEESTAPDVAWEDAIRQEGDRFLAGRTMGDSKAADCQPADRPASERPVGGRHVAGQPTIGQTIPHRERLSKVLRSLKWGLQQGANELARIHLSRVTARPVRRGDVQRLELRFTGHVSWAGQLPIPFHKVLLPRMVLPAPHAILQDLLSRQPLATAQIRTGKLPGEAIAKAFAAMISRVEGTFYLKARTPEVTAEIQLADQGLLQLTVGSLGDLDVSGRLVVNARPDEVALDLKQLEIGVGPSRVLAEGRLTAVPPTLDPLDPGQPLAARLVSASLQRRWPPAGVELVLCGRLNPGSRLSTLPLLGRYHHPLVKGGADIQVTLTNLLGEGEVLARSSPETSANDGQHASLSFTGDLSLDPGSNLMDGVRRLMPRGQGDVQGRLAWMGGTDIDLAIEGKTSFGLDGRTRVESFPELSIEAQDLVTTIEGMLWYTGKVQTSGRRPARIEADFTGSSARTEVKRATLALDPQVLNLPEGSVLEASVTDGAIGTDGLGRSQIRLRWDLKGRSPQLCSREECVEILVDDLLEGDLSVDISPGGGLTIHGAEGGLYDAHFFNALINPFSEPKRWSEVLDDDEAIDHVLAAVRLFSTDLADLAARLRKLERKARNIFRTEHIDRPGDLIPARTIARVLSRLICDSDRLEETIHPLVKQVTDGEGLDVPRVKSLLMDNLPEHDLDFEIDRALRWLKILLSPTEPVPPYDRHYVYPLVEDPAYQSLLVGLPSAGDLYRLAAGDAPIDPHQSAMVARVAPYLTLDQISYLLSVRPTCWQSGDLARLRYIKELKARVRLISRGYGGLSYTPQQLAIAFVLGEVLSVTRGEQAPARASTVRAGREHVLSRPAAVRGAGAGTGQAPTSYKLHPMLSEGLLGPQDIALLLQAGLTQPVQGRTVQLSRRLLLDAILDQPPFFLKQVLIEMGHSNTRVLASALNALFDAEQDRISQPIDLVDLFTDRLEISFPRRSDFMAGGRWAKLSYMKELNRVAEEILSEAEPYLALREHLQVERHPQPPPAHRWRKAGPMDEQAQAAIAEADELVKAWIPADGESAERREAAEAYRRAFKACAELLEQDERVLSLPWFKPFWARNHEALVVLSVVRNYQEDVDAVRSWLAVRSGKNHFEDEQELLTTVIDALYFDPSDRARLKADGLVRLLLDPEPGLLDFTIVSAMGVITEGAKGRELEETFERLEERRGIKTIRAHTETFRSLEFNAEKIAQAVQQVQTPWGYIGYSQGCANGLRAESLLVGGTPEQQKPMGSLKCRNLLFSAINGSAHGTCGDWKLLRALVQGDLFVKYYQVVLSDRAIRMFLKGISQALDSRPMVLTLAGAQSLSHAGVAALGRDGQFKDGVPTSIVRGVVNDEILPEALEFLSNVLTRQIESPLHDTQVAVDEAVGHFVWMDNSTCEVLERCDMGCLVQATHHWSPLHHETEFVRTARDRELGIYDIPKDRHVFPWIEVNHRFGIIKRKPTQGERADDG